MLTPMPDSAGKPEPDLTNLAIENDEIQFAEESETPQPEQSWKILIVDDEVEVHDITKLALDEVIFAGRSLTFLSAYSAEEAKQLMLAHPDTAIVLLDVVMETEDAGLRLINYIREELGNLAVRIILRTGQPGQAPEDMVVVKYGIDDYRTKTELTARKLFITVVMALRAFDTLTQILAVSQQLTLHLAQDQPSDATEQEKIRQLEMALQALQSNWSQPSHHKALATLDQLAEEPAPPSTEGTNALYTMSAVSRIARMVMRIIDAQSTQMGISQSKLSVLVYLSSEPDLYASPSALATHCGVSRAAMTGLLDGLTQEGYVERTSHPSDRRAVMVKLTPQGQHFLAQIAPQNDRALDLMCALDRTERQTLVELSLQFIRLLDSFVEPSL